MLKQSARGDQGVELRLINGKQQIQRAPRWAVPVALAATIMLCLSVVMNISLNTNRPTANLQARPAARTDGDSGGTVVRVLRVISRPEVVLPEAKVAGSPAPHAPVVAEQGLRAPAATSAPSGRRRRRHRAAPLPSLAAGASTAVRRCIAVGEGAGGRCTSGRRSRLQRTRGRPLQMDRSPLPRADRSIRPTRRLGYGKSTRSVRRAKTSWRTPKCAVSGRLSRVMQRNLRLLPLPSPRNSRSLQ